MLSRETFSHWCTERSADDNQYPAYIHTTSMTQRTANAVDVDNLTTLYQVANFISSLYFTMVKILHRNHH